jgi:hypothetical protein
VESFYWAYVEKRTTGILFYLFILLKLGREIRQKGLFVTWPKLRSLIFKIGNLGSYLSQDQNSGN